MGHCAPSKSRQRTFGISVRVENVRRCEVSLSLAMFKNTSSLLFVSSPLVSLLLPVSTAVSSRSVRSLTVRKLPRNRGNVGDILSLSRDRKDVVLAGRDARCCLRSGAGVALVDSAIAVVGDFFILALRLGDEVGRALRPGSAEMVRADGLELLGLWRSATAFRDFSCA